MLKKILEHKVQIQGFVIHAYAQLYSNNISTYSAYL